MTADCGSEGRGFEPRRSPPSFAGKTRGPAENPDLIYCDPSTKRLGQPSNGVVTALHEGRRVGSDLQGAGGLCPRGCLQPLHRGAQAGRRSNVAAR